jgi:hypothetical protein
LVVSDFPEEWNSHFGRLVQMATDSEGKSYKYVGSNPILITIQFNKLMKFCPIKTETLRRSSHVRVLWRYTYMIYTVRCR